MCRLCKESLPGPGGEGARKLEACVWTAETKTGRAAAYIVSWR